MDGRAYVQVYRDDRASDTELMADLIRQIMELKLSVDLRELRELLLELPDGTMTPLPLNEPAVIDATAHVAP